MRTYRNIAAAALVAGALAGCAAATKATDSVCKDIAMAQQAAGPSLDAQDPHSALGVLWADAKSACANGVVKPGVNSGWAKDVWEQVKTILPQVLPTVLPLLVGLL